MRILTVGNSPFNNTSGSSINAEIIRSYHEDGDAVASVVWDHVTNYYLSHDDGKYCFDPQEEPICELVPLNSEQPKAAVLYEYMKRFSPEVVISIGDYHEISFIYEIKRAYPHLFKWVGVLTPYSLPVHPAYKGMLDYLDYAFVTSREGAVSLGRICNIPVSYESFWKLPEHAPPYDPEVNSKFRIACCSKNSQQSNLPVLMHAVGLFLRTHEDVSAYFHVNVDDEGDYDLDNLKDRYDPGRLIKFPEEFVSFYDGIPHEKLVERFFESDVFVDCSMTSAVSLSCFEAMSVGCLPMLLDRGSASDLLVAMPEAYRLIIKDIEFLGEREGFLYIASQKHVYEQLERSYGAWKADPLGFQDAKQKCVDVCKGLAANDFVKNIKVRVAELMNNKYSVLSVDIFN